ncbi:hypothetical protein FEM48_Zijuj09G0065100 [Ziziphus jujuba var. spinosa]|uniref:Gnk2-homologous domain-containing protein n=1 Tax=Ziziphus jujuba var. spinosa TaxID=714518 RepID=A0A978URE0_ZIZJJ|nr:hypothetical protein FEM48_Zijuj09G0065100 [Ziziphus jujuba var. spinosa]
MSLPSQHTPLFFISLFFLTITIFFPSLTTSADYTNLVYKGCANENFQDPSGIFSENLKSLFDSLVSQSSQKTFSNTTSGNGANAITGWYQCRGDLTNSQCYDCVSKIPNMVNKHCGKTIAARVQLSGCYLRYEVAGFKQVSDTEQLYKTCGSSKASGSGFEDKRDSAFDMLEDGVKSGSSLFYTGSYQSVYVLGQCEGDLGTDVCGDCVKSAVERVKSECGGSISGQIYLHKCFISYSYYPNGVPDGSITTNSSSTGTRQQGTQRTVAIAVGGIAALGFLIVCLLFVRSALKKRSSTKHGF